MRSLGHLMRKCGGSPWRVDHTPHAMVTQTHALQALKPEVWVVYCVDK